jgi:hypothetical protein
MDFEAAASVSVYDTNSDEECGDGTGGGEAYDVHVYILVE